MKKILVVLLITLVTIISPTFAAGRKASSKIIKVDLTDKVFVKHLTEIRDTLNASVSDIVSGQDEGSKTFSKFAGLDGLNQSITLTKKYTVKKYKYFMKVLGKKLSKLKFSLIMKSVDGYPKRVKPIIAFINKALGKH